MAPAWSFLLPPPPPPRTDKQDTKHSPSVQEQHDTKAFSSQDPAAFVRVESLLETNSCGGWSDPAAGAVQVVAPSLLPLQQQQQQQQHAEFKTTQVPFLVNYAPHVTHYAQDNHEKKDDDDEDEEEMVFLDDDESEEDYEDQDLPEHLHDSIDTCSTPDEEHSQEENGMVFPMMAVGLPSSPLPVSVPPSKSNGIDIPLVLQPLLGLTFVPFVNPDEPQLHSAHLFHPKDPVHVTQRNPKDAHSSEEEIAIDSNNIDSSEGNDSSNTPSYGVSAANDPSTLDEEVEPRTPTSAISNRKTLRPRGRRLWSHTRQIESTSALNDPNNRATGWTKAQSERHPMRNRERQHHQNDDNTDATHQDDAVGSPCHPLFHGQSGLIRKIFLGGANHHQHHHNPCDPAGGTNSYPTSSLATNATALSNSSHRPLKGALAKTIQKMKDKRNKSQLAHSNNIRQWSGSLSSTMTLSDEGGSDKPLPTNSQSRRRTRRKSLSPLTTSKSMTALVPTSSPNTPKSTMEQPRVATNILSPTTTFTEFHALQRQAKAIQEQVELSADRVSQIQAQAEHLLESFRTASAQLQMETERLRQSQLELQRVEQQATATLQHLLEQQQSGMANGNSSEGLLAESPSPMPKKNKKRADSEEWGSVSWHPDPLLSSTTTTAPRQRAPTADEAFFGESPKTTRRKQQPLPPSYPMRRSSSSLASVTVDPPPPPFSSTRQATHSDSSLEGIRPHTEPVFSTMANRLRSNTEPHPILSTPSSSNPAEEEGQQQKTPTPNRKRSSTVPNCQIPPPLPPQRSRSFIRIDGLDIDHSANGESTGESARLVLEKIFPDNRLNNHTLVSVDDHMPMVLRELAKLGLEVCTDETDRFSPSWDTQRIIKNSKRCCHRLEPTPTWPFAPWHDAVQDNDVLLWTGTMPPKGFFAHDWPVVKVRGKVRCSPRSLLQFLLDSSQIKKYNKMSQGRDDLTILQHGIDTMPQDSVHGFAGDAKVMRALNKPKLSPKTIETVCLSYAIPLDQVAPDTYMIVNRSVWEQNDKKANGPVSMTDNHSTSIIRSEMMLGVQLIRPSPSNDKCCELTTITHVFSPGVPEIMAKRMAPASASNLMREIQAFFAKQADRSLLE